MNYKFDKDSLEIINQMIFDSSVNVGDLLNLKAQDKIELDLERRTFEDVERKRFLFWNKTVYKGKLSKLIINGVLDIKITDADKELSKNIFIQEIKYDSISESLKFYSASLLFVEVKILPNFTGELVDIKDSSFGAQGSSIGRFGFTKQEWADYLREKNYHARSRTNG